MKIVYFLKLRRRTVPTLNDSGIVMVLCTSDENTGGTIASMGDRIHPVIARHKLRLLRKFGKYYV